jgi:hypothetical protein
MKIIFKKNILKIKKNIIYKIKIYLKNKENF